MTTLSHSYRPRTRTQRVTALVAHTASIVGQAMLLFVVLIGIIYVVLGVGAAYGAEGADTIAWEECVGTSYEPGSPECVVYIAGFHRALDIAEVERWEREIDSFEFLIRQQEVKLLGLEADRMLLVQLLQGIDQAVELMPKNEATEMTFASLTLVADRIGDELKLIREDMQRIETRIVAFQQMLEELQAPEEGADCGVENPPVECLFPDK